MWRAYDTNQWTNKSVCHGTCLLHAVRTLAHNRLLLSIRDGSRKGPWLLMPWNLPTQFLVWKICPCPDHPNRILLPKNELFGMWTLWHLWASEGKDPGVQHFSVKLSASYLFPCLVQTVFNILFQTTYLITSDIMVYFFSWQRPATDYQPD